MEKFFSDFFLESAAIYSLFGTKPLSCKEILLSTEEECRETLNHLIKKSKDQKLIHAYCKNNDFPENWSKWLSYIKQFPNSPFLFRTSPSNHPKIQYAYILNIQEMVWTLKNHYHIFREEFGNEFDPIAVTYEFPNPNSQFWNFVLSNDLLSGIVFGYGERNAYFFSLEYSKLQNQPKSLFSNMMPKIEKDPPPSIKNITLPRFRSYRLPFSADPILEKYKEEQRRIQKNLSSATFFEKCHRQLIGDTSNN